MGETSLAGRVQALRDRAAGLGARAARAASADAPALLAAALEAMRAQAEALSAAEVIASAERDRYRDLFEFAPTGYLVTDPVGVIRESNRAARSLLNVPGPRYLSGEPLAVFVAPDDRAAFLSQVSGLGRCHPVWEQTLRVQPRGEGAEPRVVELTVVPFREPETREPLLRWQLRDVTEQWQATEALRKWNEDLEDRVHARTAELEKALREEMEAERSLRLADGRKDEFLAILGHELRGPLTPLRYAADILRQRCPPDPGLQRAVAVIDRQARRLGRLVDELMDLPRIAQGKVVLRAERIDLAEAARSAVDSAGGRAAAKGVTVAGPAAGDPVWVAADPGRLDQILGNLLDNAVKYTDPAGSVSVRVAREGGGAVARVRDTGVGIAPDILPRLFDLFTQSDPFAARAEGGLGIGLYLVRRLAELHGGSAEAHSGGAGEGSEFVVRLPLAPGAEHAGPGGP